MGTYRAAVLGCGPRGLDHMAAYESIDSADLVAFCDLREDRRQKAEERFPQARAYVEAADMVRQERPDVVHIVTAPSLRVELMTLVADAGVLLSTVEKPIALGVADWRRLCELERSTATKFAVCHQFRWHADLARCQQAMAADAMGPPLMMEASSCSTVPDQGTHALNYGRSLIGDPRVTSVFASVGGWDAEHPVHPGPTEAEAYMTFDNGARGLWVIGSTALRCGAKPDVKWQHVRVAAYAGNGRVTWQEFGKWEIAGPDGADRGDFGDMATWRQGNHLAQAAFHCSMFDWQEGGPAPGTNLAVSLHEWAVVLAVCLSALERRPVDLADFDPPDDLTARCAAALQSA